MIKKKGGKALHEHLRGGYLPSDKLPGKQKKTITIMVRLTNYDNEKDTISPKTMEWPVGHDPRLRVPSCSTDLKFSSNKAKHVSPSKEEDESIEGRWRLRSIKMNPQKELWDKAT